MIKGEVGQLNEADNLTIRQCTIKQKNKWLSSTAMAINANLIL
jgi:hypothetical protein